MKFEVTLILIFVTSSALLAHMGSAQRSLGMYNVDEKAISTSGISSGGAMTTQFHVAYSSKVMGVGVLAGNPYYCAKGHLATGVGACTTLPNQVDVEELIVHTYTFAGQGIIDPVNNMLNSRVFVFHGKNDHVVNKGESDHVITYYEHFVNPGNIKSSYDLDVGHAHPTMDFGNECRTTRSPFINDCNYDGSFEILNWFYGGNLQRPSGSVSLTGDFYQFDQKEFFGLSGPSAASMDTIGFVYIPSRCIDSQKACRLHVAFHGCVQGRESVGDVYARNAGYNQVGELNDIIILYPQAIKTPLSNPSGCWDWWSYTDANYANKNGVQMKAVMAMVTRLVGPKLFSS